MGKTHQALQRAEKEYRENILTLQSEKELPAIPSMPSPPALLTRNELCLHQFESLKINLLSRYRAEELKTIVFTSPAFNDGTTTTAANFAQALAKDSWRSVFLIDANLRHPCLHDIFKVDYANGLSEFLEDESITVPQLKKIKSNFYLHTSGKLRSGSAGLFQSTKFDNFLDVVRKNFDHVIIDCPPISAFAETRVIAGKVDGVVLVVNAERTRQSVALRAKKELQEVGAKMLGVVLNKRSYPIPDWLYQRL